MDRVLIDQGSTTCFNKRAILLQYPAEMTGEETQSIDTVLSLMRLHVDISQILINLFLIVTIIINCKFKFQVLSNPERATSEALKSRRLPTAVIDRSEGRSEAAHS